MFNVTSLSKKNYRTEYQVQLILVFDLRLVTLTISFDPVSGRFQVRAYSVETGEAKRRRMIPKYLLYWINSIPTSTCALVDQERDLKDGSALGDIAEHLARQRSAKFAPSGNTAAGRVQSVILQLSKMGGGWDKIPSFLGDNDVSQRLVAGMTVAPSSSSKTACSKELLSLLEFMYALDRNQNPEAQEEVKENNNSPKYTRAYVDEVKHGVSTCTSTSLIDARRERDTVRSQFALRPLPLSPHPTGKGWPGDEAVADGNYNRQRSNTAPVARPSSGKRRGTAVGEDSEKTHSSAANVNANAKEKQVRGKGSLQKAPTRVRDVHSRADERYIKEHPRADTDRYAEPAQPHVPTISDIRDRHNYFTRHVNCATNANSSEGTNTNVTNLDGNIVQPVLVEPLLYRERDALRTSREGPVPPPPPLSTAIRLPLPSQWELVQISQWVASIGVVAPLPISASRDHSNKDNNANARLDEQEVLNVLCPRSHVDEEHELDRGKSNLINLYLCNVEWCIRQLWCSSIIFYNITSIEYNH